MTRRHVWTLAVSKFHSHPFCRVHHLPSTRARHLARQEIVTGWRVTFEAQLTFDLAQSSTVTGNSPASDNVLRSRHQFVICGRCHGARRRSIPWSWTTTNR